MVQILRRLHAWPTAANTQLNMSCRFSSQLLSHLQCQQEGLVVAQGLEHLDDVGVGGDAQRTTGVSVDVHLWMRQQGGTAGTVNGWRSAQDKHAASRGPCCLRQSEGCNGCAVRCRHYWPAPGTLTCTPCEAPLHCSSVIRLPWASFSVTEPLQQPHVQQQQQQQRGSSGQAEQRSRLSKKVKTNNGGGECRVAIRGTEQKSAVSKVQALLL